MSLASKFVTFGKIIKQNGGIWKSMQTLYRTDDLKDSVFVGEDRNGNKYYQNPRYFIGKLNLYKIDLKYHLIEI